MRKLPSSTLSVDHETRESVVIAYPPNARRRMQRSVALTVLFMLAFFVSPSYAQNCADCVEFFRCKAGRSGGYTCDFQTGPCRELGSCSPILARGPAFWSGTAAFVVNNQSHAMVVGDAVLRPAACALAASVGIVLQVGAEQYIRLPIAAQIQSHQAPQLSRPELSGGRPSGSRTVALLQEH